MRLKGVKMSDNELERAICDEFVNKDFRHYGQPGPKYIENWIDIAARKPLEPVSTNPRWMRRQIKGDSGTSRRPQRCSRLRAPQ